MSDLSSNNQKTSTISFDPNSPKTWTDQRIKIFRMLRLRRQADGYFRVITSPPQHIKDRYRDLCRYVNEHSRYLGERGVRRMLYSKPVFDEHIKYQDFVYWHYILEHSLLSAVTEKRNLKYRDHLKLLIIPYVIPDLSTIVTEYLEDPILPTGGD